MKASDDAEMPEPDLDLTSSILNALDWMKSL